MIQHLNVFFGDEAEDSMNTRKVSKYFEILQTPPEIRFYERKTRRNVKSKSYLFAFANTSSLGHLQEFFHLPFLKEIF